MLLLTLAELNGAPSYLVHLAYGTLLSFRVAHNELGMKLPHSAGLGRLVGYYGASFNASLKVSLTKEGKATSCLACWRACTTSPSAGTRSRASLASDRVLATWTSVQCRLYSTPRRAVRYDDVARLCPHVLPHRPKAHRPGDDLAVADQLDLVLGPLGPVRL